MRYALLALFVILVIISALWFLKPAERVETEITIPAAPDVVWSVLTDFEGYEEWNPFLSEARGEARVGGHLYIKATPVGGSQVYGFEPEIVVADAPRELRWRSRLLVPGLFDGEHYFVLEETAEGTRLVHGEDFDGVLLFFVSPAQFSVSFEAMNEALREQVIALH